MEIKTELIEKEVEMYRNFPVWEWENDNSYKAKLMILTLVREYTRAKEELKGVLTENEALFMANLMNGWVWGCEDPKRQLLIEIQDSAELDPYEAYFGINADELCRKIEALSSFSCFVLGAMSMEIYIKIPEQQQAPEVIYLN